MGPSGSVSLLPSFEGSGHAAPSPPKSNRAIQKFEPPDFVFRQRAHGFHVRLSQRRCRLRNLVESRGRRRGVERVDLKATFKREFNASYIFHEIAYLEYLLLIYPHSYFATLSQFLH